MALTDNIVAYYKFDENAGTVVNDASPSGFNGGWTGGSGWTPGIINSAGTFNGSDYVDFGTPATGFSGNQPFAIATWVKPFSANASNAIFDYGNTGTTGNRLSLIYTATFALRSSHWSDDNTFVTTLDQGTFNYIVLTYNGTTESLYKNGTFAESWTPTALSLATNKPMLIGKSIDGNLMGTAIIDEFALRKAPFSSAEITQLWNGGAGSQLFITPRSPFGMSSLLMSD